jgi:hypothetical protein
LHSRAAIWTPYDLELAPRAKDRRRSPVDRITYGVWQRPSLAGGANS